MGRRCWSLWLLLLILAHILFLVNQAGSSSTDKIIRLGYLMRRTRTAPAINVAIERAQNESILREYNYRYISLFVHMLRPSLYESPKLSKAKYCRRRFLGYLFRLGRGKKEWNTTRYYLRQCHLIQWARRARAQGPQASGGPQTADALIFFIS